MIKSENNKSKEDIEELRQCVIEWISKPHQYEVEVDYSRSECCGGCDDYCRCSTIQGERVKKAHPQYLSVHATPQKFRNTIFHYCIERIFVALELWEEDNWLIRICGGYYGEEIGEVSMTSQTRRALEEKINQLFSIESDIEKILFVLNEEYGFIADILKKAKKASIKNISMDDIKMGNMEYHLKLRKGKCPYYSKDDEYTLPVAVCVPDGDKYRIVDGYHRYATAMQENRKKVDIILLD